MSLSGRRIAVVGGAGFIGHHLALELIAAGADVSVVDSLQVNNMIAIANDDEYPHRDLHVPILQQRLDLLREGGVPVFIQDAREYVALTDVLGEIRPEVIVHAAAVAHAGRSNKDPFSTFDHSLRTLENALDYARHGGVEHFVFLSSSMVYGDFLTPAVAEEHPLNSIGIYGALKVAGEKIVIAYQQVFELDFTIVRPSALYGPRCISRRVSQIFIENAIEGKPIRIEGDGSDRLDFTYVDDLVVGLCLVIEQPEARNEIFNMTFGAARTIREVAAIVQEHFPATEVVHGERDRLLPHRGTLSVDKAQRLLGYAPASPIEIGLPKYIDWYRELVGSHAYS